MLPTFVTTLVVIVLAVGLSWHFFLQPLRPWPDQGWQLQAAIRHSQGLGLTSQASTDVVDLAKRAYRRLAYFPPLYSLVVSMLLRLGLSVGTTVKAINVAALVLGSLGWMLLARAQLRRPSSVVLFGALLVAVDGALIPRGGTTDYVMWAILPFCVLCVLGIPTSTSFARAAVLAVSGGSLIALIAGFRWAGLFLVPAACLFLLIAPRERRLAERFTLAFLAGLPPTAAFLAMSLANRRSSGQSSYLDSLKSHWDWDKLATTFPLRSVTTIPLGFDSLLSRLDRAIDPSGGSAGLRLVLCGLPAAAMAFVFLRRMRNFPSEKDSGDSRTAFPLLAGLVVGCYLLALAIFAVRYSWTGLRWNYLEEPRYFRPLLPLAALAAIGAFEMFARHWRTVAIAVSWAGVLYLMQADFRWERTYLTYRDESWEVVQFVESLANRPGLNVVFDNDVSDYVIRPHGNVLAYVYPSPEAVPDVGVSRPADVWIVRRLGENSVYEKDPDYDAKRVTALRSNFAAVLVWRSSGDKYEVYLGKAGD